MLEKIYICLILKAPFVLIFFQSLFQRRRRKKKMIKIRRWRRKKGSYNKKRDNNNERKMKKKKRKGVTAAKFFRLCKKKKKCLFLPPTANFTIYIFEKRKTEKKVQTVIALMWKFVVKLTGALNYAMVVKLFQIVWNSFT